MKGGIEMLKRWLILLEVVLVCILVWELWSVMGCPQQQIPCFNCTVSQRQPATCGYFCRTVGTPIPYTCCCPAVSPGLGPVPNCCVATCARYDCAPLIPLIIQCPPYDLDFTPSHCSGMPFCCNVGPEPLQGYCATHQCP